MTRILLVGAAAFTLVTGVAHTDAPAAAAPGHSSSAKAECPMNTPGATVSPADTANGATLTFTTSTPGKVAELRRRVHAAAEMHNKNHAAGGGHGDMTGDGMMGGMPGSNHMMGEATGSDHMMGGAEGGGHMMSGTMMPQSHATVTDVDMGACITVTPTTPGELKELQSAVRVRADRMQQHGCGTIAKK